MPGPEDLQWVTRQDFSGGLWQRTSDRECPENGLLEATDCYPQPRGGIRAFMRMEPVSHTGLPTNSIIFALAKLRPPFPQGRLYAFVVQLDAEATGVHTVGVWSMQVSATATLDALTQIRTGTWTEDSRHNLVRVIDSSVQFASFRTDNAVGVGSDGLGYRNYYNLPVGQSTSTSSTASTVYTTQGVFRLGTTSETDTGSSGFTQVFKSSNMNNHGSTVGASRKPFWFGGVVSHQARLLSPIALQQLHNRIAMSSQANDQGSTNYVDPLGEKSGSVTWAQPSQSDYMTLAKSQVGVVVLQGDMLNPTNRQVSVSHNYLQSWPCLTEQGSFFMVQDDACYIAGQSGAQSVTPNFEGTPMNPGLYPATFTVANSDAIKLSQPCLAGDFIFAGNGYVMDTRTGAWFKSSFIPKSKLHTADTSFFRVFTYSNEVYTGDNKVLHWGYFLENQDGLETTWCGAPEYSFTLPLILNDHQQTSLREIVYHLDAFHAGSQVRTQVYSGGQRGERLVYDKEHTIEKAGPQPVRASGIKADGDYVKVRVTMKAPYSKNTPAEAPALERMLLGTQPDLRTKRA